MPKRYRTLKLHGSSRHSPMDNDELRTGSDFRLLNVSAASKRRWWKPWTWFNAWTLTCTFRSVPAQNILSTTIRDQLIWDCAQAIVRHRMSEKQLVEVVQNAVERAGRQADCGIAIDPDHNERMRVIEREIGPKVLRNDVMVAHVVKALRMGDMEIDRGLAWLIREYSQELDRVRKYLLDAKLRNPPPIVIQNATPIHLTAGVEVRAWAGRGPTVDGYVSRIDAQDEEVAVVEIVRRNN